MIKTGDTFENGSKTWRFMGMATPNSLNYQTYFLDKDGDVLVANPDWSRILPIVEEVIPEWITPTDEHAKQRMECEVRDYEHQDWAPAKLVYVSRVVGVLKYMTSIGCRWNQCRMRNPEYKGDNQR